MPFIRTKLVIENCQPVEPSEDGQTIGALVDLAISDLLHDAPMNAVPLSVEFGFEDLADWHRFVEAPRRCRK